jgi:hypothetical protein
MSLASFGTESEGVEIDMSLATRTTVRKLKRRCMSKRWQILLIAFTRFMTRSGAKTVLWHAWDSAVQTARPLA